MSVSISTRDDCKRSASSMNASTKNIASNSMNRFFRGNSMSHTQTRTHTFTQSSMRSTHTLTLHYHMSWNIVCIMSGIFDLFLFHVCFCSVVVIALFLYMLFFSIHLLFIHSLSISSVNFLFFFFFLSFRFVRPSRSFSFLSFSFYSSLYLLRSIAFHRFHSPFVTLTYNRVYPTFLPVSCIVISINLAL